MAIKPVHVVQQEVIAISHWTYLCCASHRRSAAENRELVHLTVETLLSAKAALREADILLGHVDARSPDWEKA